MSVTGFVRSYWRRAALWCFEHRLARQAPRVKLERSNWPESLRYFHQRLPPELKAHRAYFKNAWGDHRGFGENPFHVMWYMLVQEFKPANFLEIGVFRGQTISLVALCAHLKGLPCQTYGISPFIPGGEAAPFNRRDLDYYADTLANFDHFKLRHPKLVRAYSADPPALDLISSNLWDMAYIDGGHDYKIAKGDWEACSRRLRPGGVIVMDDAAANTAFAPPKFAASRGLPGPSRVTDEIDRNQFREILQVGHNRVFQKIP